MQGKGCEENWARGTGTLIGALGLGSEESLVILATPRERCTADCCRGLSAAQAVRMLAQYHMRPSVQALGSSHADATDTNMC